ncbi:tricarballylate/proton symporter TcuC [Salinisphaera hydrothermalis]|uniref:Citrate-proton symporter n=1 Tax=Salinisphaera hydrothermalis (strain C41B8) TaxID=1304275 RepID=A0A084IPF9_SALHC|nr:tricarballylate/proton symporter TcuC [Salinisphaera hydrothermalis]KEZ78593.1 citrate-proton symporter [Salinisphaera hydrothermalis C41B8]
MSSTTKVSTSSRAKNAARVLTGNFLEMFDFMIYGFYAGIIADVLFPATDPAFALLMSWITFGIGFLMRPLGALVLGAYADKHGRRAGLLLSLSIMSVGVLSIAFVPSFASIGYAAPVIVIIGRLLQGFSAGAESGTASVYLAEIAPNNHKGFFAALQPTSQEVSVLLASLIGVGLSLTLSDAQMHSWGWRVPFLIGSLLVPVLLIMRRSMTESEEFKQRRHHPSLREVSATLAKNWQLIGNAIMMILLTSVTFYLITSYIVTYGHKILGLTSMESFIVTICMATANLFVMPGVAAISDRVGRLPVLLSASAALGVCAYPTMAWLVADPSFFRLWVAVVFLGCLYGCWQGTLMISLVEIMPAKVRASGWSLAYSLTYAIFGGFTPAFVTWLIQVTGNRAMPGVALALAAIVGFIGTLLARKRLAAGRQQWLSIETTDSQPEDTAATAPSQRGFA